MSISFLVKHNARRRQPLANRLHIYRTTPRSFTNKETASRKAAQGNWIYVIETVNSKPTTYRVGYRFRSNLSELHPPGAKWENEFKYRNTSIPSTPTEGEYFDDPILIADNQLRDFLANTQGMVEIPAKYATLLDQIFIQNFFWRKSMLNSSANRNPS